MKLRNEIKRVAIMMEKRWSEFDDTKGDSYKKMDLRDLIALASKNYNNGSLRISSDREMDTSMIDLIDAMNLITMVLIHRGILEQLPIELDDIPHTGPGIEADIKDQLPAPPEPRTLHGTSFTSEVISRTLQGDAKIEVMEDIERSESEKIVATHIDEELKDSDEIKSLRETMDEGKIQAIMDAETPLENEKEDSSEMPEDVANYVPPKATLKNPTVAKTLQEITDEQAVKKEDSDDNV